MLRGISVSPSGHHGGSITSSRVHASSRTCMVTYMVAHLTLSNGVFVH